MVSVAAMRMATISMPISPTGSWVRMNVGMT